MINKKITSSGIELSSKIEDYVNKRIEAVKKFIPEKEDAQMNIKISKTTNHHQNGDIFRAEMDIYFGKDYFRTEVEAGDLPSAIDIAKDQLIDEITRTKNKHLRLLKRGHQKIKNLIKRLGNRF